MTRHDPNGVDYGWVMQMTFITTILIGVPLVALGSLFVSGLGTWRERAEFAIRVGALIWFGTAILTYWYARRARV